MGASRAGRHTHTSGLPFAGKDFEAIAAMRATRRSGAARSLRTGTARARPGDEPDEHADRERAAAEAEAIDRVAPLPVAADELVEVDDVALQPQPKAPPNAARYLFDDVPTPSS